VRTQEVLEFLLVAILSAANYDGLRKSEVRIAVPTIKCRGGDIAHALAHQPIR